LGSTPKLKKKKTRNVAFEDAEHQKENVSPTILLKSQQRNELLPKRSTFDSVLAL